MKHDETLDRKNNILVHLGGLPQKILSLHGREDLTEFVLRDLCHECCFNLKKAAFFVDNPDFNCLKGVAGYAHVENPTVCDYLWDHPEQFMARIQESPFNQRVRDLWLPSLRRVDESQEEMISKIAQTLEIGDPASHSLDVKHGNHALLIFEKENKSDAFADEYLPNGLSLLGFCPVY